MVEEMDVEYHDRVLAITSHLPHLIAYTIVGTAFDFEQQVQNDVIRYWHRASVISPASRPLIR